MTVDPDPQRGARPGWTNSQATSLTEMWNEGLSASQIGNVLNFSRAAVIGKVRRLGLSGVQRPSHPSRPVALAGQPRCGKTQAGIDRHRRKGDREFMPKPIPVKPDPQAERRITARKQMAGISNGAVKPYAPKIDTSAGKKTMIELAADDCRFICSDELFCAEPKDAGSSYCPKHRAICCYPCRPATERTQTARRFGWRGND